MVFRLNKVIDDTNYIKIQHLEVNKVENVNRALPTLLFTFLVLSTLFCIMLGLVTFIEPSQKHISNEKDLKSFTELSSQHKFNTVLSCYYNTPNLDNVSQLMPSDIKPHLCTHINIAFAQVRNKTIYMEENQYKIIKEVVKIKNVNPNLKVLLSIGGSGNHDGFSRMVIDHASRKSFIKSVKYVLRNYSLDGIDLDWEFPGIKNNNGMSKHDRRERQHFSQLLREIRMEYIREKRDYLLTVAVAAQQIIVDVAYDVDQINQYVDFVNLMTYDYHYYTKYTPFTGLNSPLYPRSSEELYMGTLNINYTVAMFQKKGLDPSKTVIGVPTYGHTFTLVNSHNTNIGSPASGFGALGSLGFVNYPEICVFTQTFNVTIITDEVTKVPYVYKDFEWVSYDSPTSVLEKTKFIKEHNLRGAMIYSLNSDDYEGKCKSLQNSKKFPLTVSIKNSLL